jgi:flavin-dependent dehydrogenase
MKIAIYGAGLVGSYLYRLLRRTGFEQITIFDKQAPSNTRCGINPCAWGTSSGFEELIGEVGLDPGNYLLRTFDSMVMNEVRVKAKVMVIDKPKLISDLLGVTEPLRSTFVTSDFERIIDATGFDRALLPAIDKEIITHCVQYRVFSQEEFELNIDLGNLGYAWRFPMNNNEYHIGAASVGMAPNKMLEKLGWLNNCSQICACKGSLRLTSPHFSQPFVDISNHDGCPVWGVGEAIGCVSPLVGEGIIPGLKSAILLLANWENPQEYGRAILRDFAWMKDERKLLDKAIQGKRIGLLDVPVLNNCTKRFDISLNYSQGAMVFKNASRNE